MTKKILALVLACALVLGMMVIPAAAADTKEVGTAADFIAACWANAKLGTEKDANGDLAFELTAPVNIKLTADIKITMTDNAQKNGSPFAGTTNRQIVYVLPGSVIDLNGHCLNMNNVKFFYSDGTAKAEDQSAPLFKNGTIWGAFGNSTNTVWCFENANGILGGLVTDYYTTSADSFKSNSVSDYIAPAGLKVHLQHDNGGVYEFAKCTCPKNLILSTGATLDGAGDFHLTSDEANIVFEAATAADLAPARIMMADKIVLTADITDANLSVVVPGNAVLDYAGHKLTCKGITGTTIDTGVTEPAAPAETAPAAPAETTPAAPTEVPAVIAPAPTAAAGTKYTVKDGDCLYAIARSLMGGGWNWPALYEANKAVIGSNPRLIYTGTVLTIPGANDIAASDIPIAPVIAPVGPVEIVTPAEPAAPAVAIVPTGEKYTVYESMLNPAKEEVGGVTVKNFGIFDTGIVPTSTTRVQMDCIYDGNWEGQCFFGSALGGVADSGFTFITKNANGGAYNAIYAGTATVLAIPMGTFRASVDFNYATASGRGVSVTPEGQQKLQADFAKNDMAYENTLTLLGTHKGTDTFSNYARTCTVFSVKISDNPAVGTETVLADFVVATDKDGTIGLLDQVTGKFITSDKRPTATLSVNNAIGTAYVDNGKVTYVANGAAALAENAPAEPAKDENVIYSVLKTRSGSDATLSRGKGWEVFPTAASITLDGADNKTLGDANVGRNYRFELKDGVIVKMTALIGAQNYTSYVTTDANGNFVIDNLKKNADGSYTFDLKNSVKGDVSGLTLPAGANTEDVDGNAFEPQNGDIIGTAVEKENPQTCLMLRMIKSRK